MSPRPTLRQTSPSPRTRRARSAGALTLALAMIPAAASAAHGDDPTVLTPFGGGYVTSTLAGFADAAALGASGPTVDLVVVPAAYGDGAKDRAENLRLAADRTAQLDAA
jgi:hypothetical protein